MNQQLHHSNSSPITPKKDEDPVVAPHNHFTQDEILGQTEDHTPTDTPLSGGKTSSYKATETSSSQCQAFTDAGQETKSTPQVTSSQPAEPETVRDIGEVKVAIPSFQEPDAAVGMQLVLHLDPFKINHDHELQLQYNKHL